MQFVYFVHLFMALGPTMRHLIHDMTITHICNHEKTAIFMQPPYRVKASRICFNEHLAAFSRIKLIQSF